VTAFTFAEAVFSPLLPPPTEDSLRLAYRLAGSFNLRGRLRQLFHVLTDDKIGSGPRPAPHSLQTKPKPTDQPETSQSVDIAVTPPVVDLADPGDSGEPALAGKTVKRKADDQGRAKSKR
jgi:hypothetical protein